jgi:hypothetical protein
MIKFQNYSHYKLPITTDPLKYGKLLDQTDNKFILQLTTKNIAVIKQIGNENFVRIFRNGDLVLEFRDKILEENSFTRYIHDTRFYYENDRLISTQILGRLGTTTIFESNDNNPVYLLHKNTDAIKLKTSEDINPLYLLNKNNNFEKTYLENTYIFKNYPASSFILFKLSLIFLIYIILFVIFPENNENIAMAGLLSKNIIKLRRKEAVHS